MAQIDQSKLTRFNAYVETLPAQQRGVLILALWANAVLSVALDGAWLVLVIRAHQRAAPIECRWRWTSHGRAARP
jgi:hypothetical protein